ncbi:T3SS polymerization control protein YopR [Yersinia pseudotuberculosis]|uniref:T3SS polymerization control protein YopR n=1 Tax=Yersinia pseudotuberculosis TaxID=633 RepID=UPI0038B65026
MTVTLNRGSITSLMSSSQAVSTLQPVASELKTQLENKLKSESAEKTREVLWQQYYASTPPDHAVLEVLATPVREALLARFGQHQGSVVPAIDLPELRSVLQQFDSFGKRWEAILLQVLEGIKPNESQVGLPYLSELINKELMILLPSNSIVDSLLHNSHQIDMDT